MSSESVSLRCFATFAAELAELRQMHALSVAARELFTKFSHELKNENIIKYWYTEKEIDKKIKASDLRKDTVNKSVLVLGWGSFEQFMRNLVRETAEQRNKSGWPNGIMPKNVISQHSIICSNLICADARGELSHYSVSRSEVATDMRNLICVDGSPKLNAEALASFGGKFREDELARLGHRVGVDLSWMNLGKNNDLRNLSEKVGADAVGKWAEKLFCKVRDSRNGFAHRGAGEATLQWEDVDKYLFYLETLAEAIVKTVVSEMEA